LSWPPSAPNPTLREEIDVERQTFRNAGLIGPDALSLQWKAHADGIKTVFVIALENHNWTQPASQTSPQQIFKNPAAPFINSLVNGTAVATINGRPVNISRQVAYATNYLNVLSTSGNNPHVHPSEPNYFWAEQFFGLRRR
jgi:phosphatidylinositol-3-phosphatase